MAYAYKYLNNALYLSSIHEDEAEKANTLATTTSTNINNDNDNDNTTTSDIHSCVKASIMILLSYVTLELNHPLEAYTTAKSFLGMCIDIDIYVYVLYV